MREDHFDVVIVGAGSAGCVLADKLTEGRPHQKILLIEAGSRDRMEMLHVPAGFNYVAFDKRVIWDYKTEPEPGLGGRRIDYVRGRVLGGSSSINAMVHVRGNPADYDGWAASGCTGWGWADVLPHFRDMEQHADGASGLHGAGGPMPVTPAQRHPASDAFIKAMVQSGLRFTSDFDAGGQEGAGYYHQAVKRGRRQSAAKTFLRRALRRPNLSLCTDSIVERIEFDGKVATGVWVSRKGAPGVLMRGRKIVLCGGTVGSAQLLQLSGIGPAARLSKLGIPVLIDRPAVGENVQDHYQAPVVVRTRNIPTLNDYAGGLALLGQIARYYLRRDGLLAYNATQAGAFVRSAGDVPHPDLQILFAPGALDPAAHPRKLDKTAGVTAIVCALQPESRGHIRITSRRAQDYPEILGGYLAHPYDRAMMLRGMRFLRKVFAQEALRPYVAEEFAPGTGVASDEDLLDFCRRKGDSVHHPVGSCRMGGDGDAVADPELRVRGVGGLYVADASVMPRIIRGNTNAATLMIASKASEIIRRGK
ncbi:GMC family oxidoreductase [Pollutimonas bauzanensis]|uniref:Choline dehydrogenase n=1 Tax=Pollutimonas bauzanensis TaxID=658167 RepID=A0A1M6A4Y5_9BURK|nr:GMC family oxidoreductase N-terminal domain-containing protein [Pollutimonas bauzanensis]SHI31546.1 choline dehydrogenase [Pollutimonas bauzanensis]